MTLTLLQVPWARSLASNSPHAISFTSTLPLVLKTPPVISARYKSVNKRRRGRRSFFLTNCNLANTGFLNSLYWFDGKSAEAWKKKIVLIWELESWGSHGATLSSLLCLVVCDKLSSKNKHFGENIFQTLNYQTEYL